MNCSNWTSELVESARRSGLRVAPGRELRAHLNLCAGCRERWDAERQLTSHIEVMREQMRLQRSPAGQRDALMRDFSRIYARGVMPSWAWALSAAAALVLAVLIGHMLGEATRKPAREVRRSQAFVYEASDVLSNDASALSADDFVAVPYTPPLAQGEMVRVVHEELYPEALAGMGVEVDPTWTDRVPADVVVGEDGLPRAVRISENNVEN
jgi:hypothetical protein